MIEKADLINYTLRLPEDYRRRLELEASARGRSLNQQIIRVIEMYFAGAGYPGGLISSGEQMFQVHTELVDDGLSETVCEFSLENFKTGKVEAHYLIGINRTLIEDLKISDNTQAAKEIGLALLNFHAKKGRDIRSLCWTQFERKRVITDSEVVNIETVPDFLELLAKGQWTDELLVPDEELEAIKTMLITARLEQKSAEIIKHMNDGDEMWIQIGDRKFDGPNKSIYVKALSKMGLLSLIDLQPRRDRAYNSYRLTYEADQYLAKLASLAI
jgi:hypothetical protein